MEPETIREIVTQLTPPSQYVFQLLVEKQIRYNLAQLWVSGVLTVVLAVVMFVSYAKADEDDDYWIVFIMSLVSIGMGVAFLITGIIEHPIPEAVVLSRWLQ